LDPLEILVAEIRKIIDRTTLAEGESEGDLIGRLIRRQLADGHGVRENITLDSIEGRGIGTFEMASYTRVRAEVTTIDSQRFKEAIGSSPGLAKIGEVRSEMPPLLGATEIGISDTAGVVIEVQDIARATRNDVRADELSQSEVNVRIEEDTQVTIGTPVADGNLTVALQVILVDCRTIIVIGIIVVDEVGECRDEGGGERTKRRRDDRNGDLGRLEVIVDAIFTSGIPNVVGSSRATAKPTEGSIRSINLLIKAIPIKSGVSKENPTLKGASINLDTKSIRNL
jgi:hypothetical protein